MDEKPLRPVFIGMHGLEFPGIFHRGKPGFQKVGAEAKQHIGRIDMIAAQPVDAEAHMIGGLQVFVGERFEHHRRPGLVGIQQLPHGGQCRIAHDLRQEKDPIGSGRDRPCQFFTDQGFRRLRRHGLPAVVDLDQRCFDPVGVVDALERRLASHAEFSAVDGMEGVTFDLDHPALTVFGDNAATGGTFAAGGGIPARFSGHHVVRCVNQGIEVFFFVTRATRRNGQAADTGNLQECSAIHE